jgi:6-phosphogluconate dehydrogenase
MKNALGVYGVGVMGRGLALNIASKGHRVAIFNKEIDRMVAVVEGARRENIHSIHGYNTVRDFMESLERPKKVLMMVPAGQPVDDVIADIKPFLRAGDIVVDGGNEWYARTEHRQTLMGMYGVNFIGMGVSGGEHGARHGAAFMPSGDPYAVNTVLPFFQDASDPNSTPSYVGAGGAGQYVKTVHNGIEYAIMQIIAETYHVLKHVYKKDNNSIADFFDTSNHMINSYLLEITSKILRRTDAEGTSLVNMILDVPRMNGTGAWTVKDAFESLVSCPSITAAIDARITASKRAERLELSALCRSWSPSAPVAGSSEDQLATSMMLCMYMTYLQGFLLIMQKSANKNWGVNPARLAQIWMGGCIIRSDILLFFIETEPEHYKKDMFNMFQDKFATLAELVSTCALYGASTPVLAATYQYILANIQAQSPANLIQAQRDYFGSHGYERIDIPGKFHTQW